MRGREKEIERKGKRERDRERDEKKGGVTYVSILISRSINLATYVSINLSLYIYLNIFLYSVRYICFFLFFSIRLFLVNHYSPDVYALLSFN